MGMHISDILTAERIFLDANGSTVRTKQDALRVLASLLGPPVSAPGDVIERMLSEREQLQSTGIGDGVAIPHASLGAAACRAAALLLSAHGVPFDAIDGKHVHIILGVVGPKDATGEHLRVLARVSRLLRDAPTRRILVASSDAVQAFQLIESRDQTFR
jgi:nitrogen PTS system EIIA component